MTIAVEQTPPSDYLTRLAASDLGRGYKALVVREMAIERGHTVLDLGCGPGADLRAFAESVGPARPAIGYAPAPRLGTRLVEPRGLEPLDPHTASWVIGHCG
jgi:hypothetical protein